MHSPDKLDLAKELEAKAAAKGVQFLLPTDVVLADNFAPDANSQIAKIEAIPDGWMGLDIGPDSVKVFQDALADCQTVIWNGPMGVFEFDKFAAGTNGIAHTLADLSAKGTITIIGGGDSVAAVEKVGVADKMSHISTGGGASLELLEGKVLPGVAASWENKDNRQFTFHLRPDARWSNGDPVRAVLKGGPVRLTQEMDDGTRMTAKALTARAEAWLTAHNRLFQTVSHTP